MKKNLLTFLAICLFASSNLFAQFPGSGTQQSPFLISSKADMEYLAQLVELEYDFEGQYFLLTQDLKLFNTVTTVIGVTKYFKGNFDGGGHEIAVNINSSYLGGVFGRIQGATIKNLTVSGSVTVASASGGLGGGICGYAYNSYEPSYVPSTIDNCRNYSMVSGYASDFNSMIRLGGICGYGTSVIITNCYNTGTISASVNNSGNFYTGGICGIGHAFGYAYPISISNCYNTGTISGTGNVGGIYGGALLSDDQCNINNCYNTGNISGTNSSIYSTVAGIAGDATAIINNCYNTGNISNSSSAGRASGIGGAVVLNCFAANTQITVPTLANGARIGHGSTISNCYALSSMIINGYPVYSQITANEKHGANMDISSFQSQTWISNYLGWDFNTIWKQRAGEFPVLFYQKYSPVITFTIASVRYGDIITLNATSDNNAMPLIYESSDNTIAEITGNTLIARKAGLVTITARQNENSEYTAGQTTFNLNIQKIPVTITANSATVTYGDTPPAFTCQYSGFINGETANVLTQLPVLTCYAIEVGMHNIVPSGAEAQNYSFIYQNGTLTITKALLTITANNVIWQIGTPRPDFTLSYSGFKYNDNHSNLWQLPTITCAANENSPVGFYDIILSGGSAVFYDFILVNGTLERTEQSNNIPTINNHNNIQIYPNPATDKLYIIPAAEDLGRAMRIKFYDLLGKEVLIQAINGKTEINISNLPQGIYNIQLVSEGQIIGNSKIIKQ
jgi:hypothetical protein